MELIIVASTSCFVFLVLLCVFHFMSQKPTNKLAKRPPGPPTIPFLSNLRWLGKSVEQLEEAVHELHSKYGPVVSVQMGRDKAIFITSADLAHKILIDHGANFAGRPSTLIQIGLMVSKQKSISMSNYGLEWRVLRRNLTSGICHPSRIKANGGAREFVLGILKNKIKSESMSGKEVVLVVDLLHNAMFHVLVLMCFGEDNDLDDETLEKITEVQRDLIDKFHKFIILDYLPEFFTKIIFADRWAELIELRNRQENLILPLIRARKGKSSTSSYSISYVDTLLNLTLPEERNRKLTEKEILGLCSEFVNAGTDSTTSAMQWVMANIVKHQEIQTKVYEEIKEVSPVHGEVIKEDELQKLPYLKAVVLESLRRHPPAHFVLPHVVAEEKVVDGYLFPKNATVNFMVAKMGWDPTVWEEPMEFRPERFMVGSDSKVFDLTGIKGIKMMPFGVGRRICPGFSLAILHLEYFVANLVKEFQWTVREGEDVDLSERQTFSTVILKYPLRALATERKS